jgi:hypothetical protein
MRSGACSGILIPRCDPGYLKGGDLPNPLAIGVSLGGLLLDLVAPRPKPRAGYVQAVSRTGTVERREREYAAPPVASGQPGVTA